MIWGFLNIESTSISDLSGLSNLEKVGYTTYGQITIVGNQNLHDISFLNNLQMIADNAIGLAFFDSIDANSLRLNIDNLSIYLDFVNGFSDLRFLENVNSLNNITLNECNEFKDFSGMTNMATIGGIQIENCSSFDSLNGLNNLQSLDYLVIKENAAFNDFCGVIGLIDSNIIDASSVAVVKEWIGNPTFYTEQEMRDLCSPPIACQYEDIDPSHYAFDAVTYLCNNGLLDDDDSCHADDCINRAELAKLAYLSIDLQNMAVADTFPSPFQDLQDTTTWFYTYAKNLSYLEYQDGIAPYDKTYFNFYASKHISRAHALKVLLETWNIPLQTGTGLPYNDTPTTHDAYKYIYTAYQLGIIQDNTEHIFGPDVDVYRGEVFVFLYKMMHTLALTPPVPTTADFFIPGNYTPETFATYNSLHSGNFNFYTKTSFSISSVGLPLNFEHTYNSYLTEMPEALTPLRPLGKAWSHTYNSCIMEIEGDEENPDDYRVVVALPGGGFNVYQLEIDQYICETLGVYNLLERTSSTEFTVTTKKQIVYTYQKPAGTAASFPYVLTSVTDRNGNTLTVNYEDSEYLAGFKRIASVIGTAGRTLSFSYYSST
ncbi:MAG TPA: S-layer homology domain-containing protein, partial [Prolixibacteraceae bacterium]|nr:S-layer homology domain-containing protein [Prolixibacteraceae bacterium]